MQPVWWERCFWKSRLLLCVEWKTDGVIDGDWMKIVSRYKQQEETGKDWNKRCMFTYALHIVENIAAGGSPSRHRLRRDVIGRFHSCQATALTCTHYTDDAGSSLRVTRSLAHYRAMANIRRQCHKSWTCVGSLYWYCSAASVGSGGIKHKISKLLGNAIWRLVHNK